MIATLPYLTDAFRQYNHQIFDDKLPVPTLKLSHARTRLGQMAYKRKRKWGRIKYYDFTISISAAYDLPQKELDDVIIHEMIHYAIVYTGLRDSSAHGTVFRGMMEAINRKHGRHITITARRQRLTSTAPHPSTPSTYLVLAIETSDGHHFLSSVNPRYADQLALKLSTARGIKSYSWYKSTDSFFASMPRVRSLRGKKINKEQLETMCASMTSLR